MDELLLTRQEAAKMLTISVRALDRLKAENRIDWVPMGRLVRFRREDLEAYTKALVRTGVAPQPTLPRVTPRAGALETFDLAARERAIPKRRTSRSA